MQGSPPWELYLLCQIGYSFFDKRIAFQKGSKEGEVQQCCVLYIEDTAWIVLHAVAFVKASGMLDGAHWQLGRIGNILNGWIPIPKLPYAILFILQQFEDVIA